MQEKRPIFCPRPRTPKKGEQRAAPIFIAIVHRQSARFRCPHRAQRFLYPNAPVHFDGVLLRCLVVENEPLEVGPGLHCARTRCRCCPAPRSAASWPQISCRRPARGRKASLDRRPPAASKVSPRGQRSPDERAQEHLARLGAAAAARRWWPPPPTARRATTCSSTTSTAYSSARTGPGGPARRLRGRRWLCGCARGRTTCCWMLLWGNGPMATVGAVGVLVVLQMVFVDGKNVATA